MSEQIKNKNIVKNEQYSNKSFKGNIFEDYNVIIKPNKNNGETGIEIENIIFSGKLIGRILINHTSLTNINISHTSVVETRLNNSLIRNLNSSYTSYNELTLRGTEVYDSLILTSNVKSSLFENTGIIDMFADHLSIENSRLENVRLIWGYYNNTSIENCKFSGDIDIRSTFRHLELKNVTFESDAKIDVRLSEFNKNKKVVLNNVKLEEGAKLRLPKGLDYKLDEERNITIIEVVEYNSNTETDKDNSESLGTKFQDGIPTKIQEQN